MRKNVSWKTPEDQPKVCVAFLLLFGIILLGISCSKETRSTKTSGNSGSTTGSAMANSKHWHATPNLRGKHGYIDGSGKQVLAPVFEEAHDFSEGIATLKSQAGWHLMTSDGKILDAGDFEKLDNFHDGSCLARVLTPQGYFYGFLDKSGKIAIPFQFTLAFRFADGVAPATRDGTRWGLINHTGDFVVEPRFRCIFDLREGLAAFKQGEKWGFMDKTGKIVIQPQFDDVDFMSAGFSEGTALVTVNGKQGFIDKHGEWTIKPVYEKFTRNFSEGLAVVEKSEKEWGFINRKGEFVIPAKFGWLGNFKEGLAGAGAELGGKRDSGYIDRTGDYVIPPLFDRVEEFHDGLGAVAIDDECALIDASGRFVWKDPAFPIKGQTVWTEIHPATTSGK